jgi:glutamine synthetase adenylyltransferase
MTRTESGFQTVDSQMADLAHNLREEMSGQWLQLQSQLGELKSEFESVAALAAQAAAEASAASCKVSEQAAKMMVASESQGTNTSFAGIAVSDAVDEMKSQIAEFGFQLEQQSSDMSNLQNKIMQQTDHMIEESESRVMTHVRQAEENLALRLTLHQQGSQKSHEETLNEKLQQMTAQIETAIDQVRKLETGHEGFDVFF